MSCYDPMLGIPTGSINKETGKEKLKIVNAKKFGYDPRNPKFKDYIVIPCGHCLGCNLDRSRQWADRMILELQETGKGLFVTLTYDNEHAIWSDKGFTTVSKRDCQLWMKRLRERYGNVRIRFYLAAEYGPKTKRAHYHCILFGIDRSDIPNCLFSGKNELGQNYYNSDWFDEIWSKGHVTIADINYRTCAYVARYVNKKLKFDKYGIDEYTERGVEREFNLMSRMPGLGYYYLEKNPECLDMVNIHVPTEDDGKEISIPKYFLRQLNREGTDKRPNLLYSPDNYDRICEQRRQLAKNSEFKKLYQTTLSYVEFLEQQEELKKEAIRKLRDNKV